MAIWNTPAYRRWYNIKSRCENPRNEKFSDYEGGEFFCANGGSSSTILLRI